MRWGHWRNSGESNLAHSTEKGLGGVMEVETEAMVLVVMVVAEKGGLGGHRL